jgi:hypothetical protein
MLNSNIINSASSTTKTSRHDTAEILLKMAPSTTNQIKSNQIRKGSLFPFQFSVTFYIPTLWLGLLYL